MAMKLKKDADTARLDPAYVKAIEEAQADVDAGRTIPFEKVRRWLLSWGTAKELPPPRCK
jgi:predicted transcriptional regulator